MIVNYDKVKSYVMYLIGTLLVFPFFFGGYWFAANDLMGQLFEPAKNQNTMITIWENVDTVWKKVIEWSTEVSIGGKNSGIGQSPSIIVKVTRLLLILTITLSVTMILYNGMIYIIQTWQWKEWKSLIKNVLLIVVWILVALFSVVIINVIQSIPTTLDQELAKDENTQAEDNKALNGWNEKTSWSKIWKQITGKDNEWWSENISEEDAKLLVEDSAFTYFKRQNVKMYTWADGTWMVILSWWSHVRMVDAYLDGIQ